jgi:hypothetical protein
MRGYYISFLFFLASLNMISQESFIEMNDRALRTNNIISSPFYSYYNNKLVYIRNSSLYDNSNDNRLQDLLLNCNNEEIISLVKKARKNKRREYIGFAAIPLGIVAAACIRTNSMNNSFLRPMGIACLTASVSCIIISPVATKRKNANYREAVKQYNLRF